MTKYCTGWVKIPFTKWGVRSCCDVPEPIVFELVDMAHPTMNEHIDVRVNNMTGGADVGTHRYTEPVMMK